MPKKAISKKKIPIKKATSTKAKFQNTNIEKVLITNFISLQKVMTKLSMDFNNLNTQISKLLELFEISAKTLAEKDIKLNLGKEEKKMVEKLDTLLDQNKIIARSLTFLHEIPGDSVQQMAPPIQQMQKSMPLQNQTAPPMQRPISPIQPRMASPQFPPLKQGANTGEYQKSQKPSHQKSPQPEKKNETVF